MDRDEGYSIDDIFSPAMPSSIYSNSPWSEDGVFTEDEDETVEITCSYCREEKQWLANLRARNEAMEAEILALAREKSEMQRTMELETNDIIGNSTRP